MHRFHAAALILFALLGMALPSAASVEVWTDEDWSGAAYGSIDGIDPETEPGSLLLANDPDRLVFAFDASPDYLGAWTMVAWQNRLYVGAGDYPMSNDGGDIVAYDCATDSSWVDYSVFEQGIAVLKTSGGKIYSPGADSMGSHAWGNLYLNDGSGWLRRETIPNGVHVNDVGFHDGRVWVSTGSGAGSAPGEMFSSTDEGETWTEEFQLDTVPPESFRRLYGITEYQGSLFVMSDFKQPEGKVIFEFDGLGMTTHTISAPGSEGLSAFVQFQGKLLCLTRTILDTYDGSGWSSWVLPFATTTYVCNAIATYRDRVYLGGIETVIASSDLSVWNDVQVAPVAGLEIKSFAECRGRLYAGTLGGAEVFVTAAAEEGTLVSLPHQFQLPICAGTVEWSALLPGAATGVALQLRSATSEAGLATAVFSGPDGSPAGWYETSGSQLSAVHCGDSWLQYRVRLTSTEPRLAPILASVTLRVDSEATGLAESESTGGFTLRTWPNPFVDSIRLAADGDRLDRSEFAVYDLRGRLLRVLSPSGASVLWDGRDDRGRPLPAGVYLIRCSDDDGQSRTRRVLRLR